MSSDVPAIGQRLDSPHRSALSPGLHWPSDSELPGVVRIRGFLDPVTCETLRAVASEIVSRSFRDRRPTVVFGGPQASHDQNPLFLDSGNVARVFHEHVESGHSD